MTLHDDLHAELSRLCDAQPTQPRDRLTGVTRRARRVRRTRAAVSLAAVLAVAAPVGVLALQPHHAAAPRYAGVATWPDRSQSGHLGIGTGALASWEDAHPTGGSGKVSWLYRGVVSRPGRQDLYVAVWRTPSTVILAQAETTTVNEQGFLPDQAGQAGPTGGWVFYTVAVDKAPPVLGLYIGTVQGDQRFETSLFALAAPGTRQLHWTSYGLPFATLDGGGPTDRAGDLTSTDGVFLDDAGPLAGSVTLQVPGAGSQAFGFGGQQVPLTQPPAPDVPTGFTLVAGGAGATDATSFTGTTYDTFDNQRLPVLTAVRCYGGGTLRLAFGKAALGRASCDGRTHTFTGAPPRRSDGLQLTGDRVQSYRFVSGTVTHP